MYAALAYLAGIPMIVVPQVTGGFTPYETRSYKLLRSLLVVRSHRMGYYAPLEYLKLLESLDIYTTDTKKHLGFSNTATEKIDKLFIERGFIVGKDLIVGISASAGNKIKKWSAKSFAEVAVYLYQKYHAKLLIIGGKGDLGETAEMLSFLPKDIPVCNTVDRLSVDELKALISKLSLFVSVDTGPIYIAEAFGVPTVDIVGPMDEREQPPIGEKHKVVFLPDRKSPVLHIMNARVYDVVEARRQVESITVGMVTDAIDSLIQK
jgi:ADP-heptose:LPS heptosyltransferase